jgi:hypothetical protein
MRPGAAVVVLAILVGAAAGWAGEVYRWTDENGVTHYADVPPPNVRTETQVLPDRPPPPAQAAPAAEAAPAGTASAPATTPGAVSKGPARVVVTGQNEEPLGDTRHGISGTVQNEGGEVARDVFVTVQVSSQGEDCLSEEVDVRPSTLKPGEKGEFALDLDHPCFRGPIQLSLRARWK